jgi:ribosomal protein S18 acetylase RimI-like enzyme
LARASPLTRTALASAVKENLYAFFRSFSRSAVAEFSESAGLARWHTRIPHPWFNAVLVARPPAGDDAETIRETQQYFRARGVPIFTWWLEPGLQITEWANSLLPHGFGFDHNTPGMALDLAALPEAISHTARPEIREVENLEALQTWAVTFCQGYQLPKAMTPAFYELVASLGLDLPFRYYLGLLDGMPVATSTLFLGAGVAGIYNVATLPQARGQGLGAQITLHPLRQAREMRYSAGVLQSSEMGFSLYRRLGFEKVCEMEHFYWKDNL